MGFPRHSMQNPLLIDDDDTSNEKLLPPTDRKREMYCSPLEENTSRHDKDHKKAYNGVRNESHNYREVQEDSDELDRDINCHDYSVDQKMLNFGNTGSEGTSGYVFKDMNVII